MDYQSILNEIAEEVTPLLNDGKVADYIPALAEVNPNQFAMTLTLFDGNQYRIGQADTLFSVQSISNVFTFTLALKFYRTELYKRIGREPSGNPFNSLVQLEYEHGKPRNPFINAGAIVISDILISNLDNPKEDFLAFVRSVSSNTDLNYPSKVADSSKEAGFRTVTLCNFIKPFGNINNDRSEERRVGYKL